MDKVKASTEVFVPHNRRSVCRACAGSGARDGKVCQICGGLGQVSEARSGRGASQWVMG